MAEATLPGVQALPPRLDALLAQLRAPQARQVVIRGAASVCKADEGSREPDHLMAEWITGIWRGRFLRLRICQLCEAVEVRDQTRTVVPVIGSTIRSTPDILLGWYTGSRPAGRTYH